MALLQSPIIVGMAEIWLAECCVTRRWSVHQEGGGGSKGETPTGFCGISSTEVVRIKPATMGYISAVFPPVKVNPVEEGTGNPGYILFWF